MKKTTADRLRQIMEERSWRQSDILDAAKPFCDMFRVKLSKGSLSQYLSGQVEPGQTKLFVLAKALNVNEAWLMGYDVDRERSDADSFAHGGIPMPTMRRVPRIGAIARGEPILAEQNFDGYDAVPDFVNCDFTLVCKGDSMTGARICDGDIVCIKQQPEVENGQIAAVQIGEDSATLKRIRYLPGGVALWPENPAYAPMIFTGEDVSKIRILGLATHFISRVI
jgi:repressor LexA